MGRAPRSFWWLFRAAPFGILSSLGALAVVGAPQGSGSPVLYLVLGASMAVTGRRMLKRRGDGRKQLRRRARASARELDRVAREDRVAASQMKRIAALQDGLIESWELLPEDYRPLLDEDMFAIIGEVEDTVHLSRRRAAIRRHLESVEQRHVPQRIECLERDLAELEPESPLRASLESALAGRREELSGCHDLLNGISTINAQLESAESLLGNLRGELLALRPGLASHRADPDLARLRERVAYFRHSLDEITRRADVPVEELPAR